MKPITVADLMPSTDGNSFSAEDICKIIKTCKQCGVHELKLDTLEVKFDSSLQARRKSSGQSAETLKPEDVSTVPDEVIVQVEEKAVIEQNVLAREAELSTMQILSPEQYEDLEVSGDLDEEGSRQDDFRT